MLAIKIDVRRRPASQRKVFSGWFAEGFRHGRFERCDSSPPRLGYARIRCLHDHLPPRIDGLMMVADRYCEEIGRQRSCSMSYNKVIKPARILAFFLAVSWWAIAVKGVTYESEDKNWTRRRKKDREAQRPKTGCPVLVADWTAISLTPRSFCIFSLRLPAPPPCFCRN